MGKFKFKCPNCGQEITFGVAEKDDPINGQKFDYIVIEEVEDKSKKD